MTQFEAVLYSIKDMDTDMLDTILDNSVLYDQASKNVFLIKLDEIFNLFKANGDTSIVLEKGRCACEKCQMETKKGYFLIGNVSRDCLNLMFEINDQQRVVNIYYCGDFGMIDGYSMRYDFIPEKPDLELNEYKSIDYYKDELFAFEPSDFYLDISFRCKEAFELIEKGGEREIDLKTIDQWLFDHKKLNEEVLFYTYASICNFKDLYGKLHNINSYVPYLELAEKAYNEYNTKKIISEAELLNWILKHEDLATNHLTLFSRHLRTAEQASERLYILEKCKFYIFKQHFLSIINFEKLFRDQCLKLFKESFVAYGVKNENDIGFEEYSFEFLYKNYLKFHQTSE